MREMTFQIGDGLGEGVDNPSAQQIQQFLDKLDIDDEQHREVWLTHKSTGWTLSCLPNSEVVFYETAVGSEYKPRHLINVSRAKMLELLQKLANGQLGELEREHWKYGQTSELPPPPVGSKDLHRDFWNQLISAKRRPKLECRKEGCQKAPIELSVFCPKHHFEKTLKFQCPFE
jgi:hypothetical protein